jgi:hypothetical protein
VFLVVVSSQSTELYFYTVPCVRIAQCVFIFSVLTASHLIRRSSLGLDRSTGIRHDDILLNGV